MASMSIQFFASIDDLARIAADWLHNEDVQAAAIEYLPFRAMPFSHADVDSILHNQRVRRLLFSERPIVCGVIDNDELLDTNAGALLLDIGRLGDRGLIESRLTTTHVTARWKRLGAKIKRITRAGMIGTNENSGGSSLYKAYRYTTTVASMCAADVPLRPFPQSPVLLRPLRSE